MTSRTIANGEDKLYHLLDLNDLGLKDIPVGQRASVKREVADFLKEEILRDVSRGISPVKGEGRFQRVEAEYASNEKGGVRTANLELDGDLLNDFDVTSSRGSTLKVGHEGGEVPKADGHNLMSGKAQSWGKKVNRPQRRYIPDDNQLFKNRIVSGMKQIIKDNTPTPQRETRDVGRVSSAAETADQVTVGISDIFDDDVIASLLAQVDRGN